MKAKELTLTALFAALMCVIAPFSIPLTGAVPITLGTFILYLTGAVLGWKKGLISVAVYLIIGSIGVPVFSGFGAGIGVLAGPTGGYLIGYLFCVAVVGALVDRFSTRFWAYPAGMVLGTAVLYFFGTAWFLIQSGGGLWPALMTCVVPFLPFDCVKIIVESGVSFALRRVLSKKSALRLD